jgi:sugar phosphate isomerase/epimerase
MQNSQQIGKPAWLGALDTGIPASTKDHPMRPGYYSTMLSHLSLPEAATVVAKAGYTDLAINGDGIPSNFPPHLTPEMSFDHCRELAGAVRAAGLLIPAMSVNFYFFIKDEAERQRGLTHVSAMIDRAAAIGVDYVHLCSGRPAPGQDEAAMMPLFIQTMHAVLRKASDKGVSVGLESCAPHMYPQCSRYLELAEALQPMDLAVNFDPSHFVAIGEDPIKAVYRLAPLIRHVHIKDAKGRYPKFSFPPLGEGEIDFPKLITALRDIGYAGALTIEYEANYFGWNIDPMTVLTGSRAFLRDLGV